MGTHRFSDTVNLQDGPPWQKELNLAAELATLEELLKQTESAWSTLWSQLQVFERRYRRLFGARYVTLDELNAEIAEAEARLHADDRLAKERARLFRRRANESAQTAFAARPARSRNIRHPWKSLKKLYRELVKILHPDLTTDEQEHVQRHQMMTEVNKAYANGDEQRLRTILEEWEGCLSRVYGNDHEANYIHHRFAIIRVKLRLFEIEMEMEIMKGSDLYQLYDKAVQANNEGRDLLKEMAHETDNEIRNAKNRLAELLKEEQS